MNESTRAYIYRVALAVLALLAFYGVVSEEEIPLIIGVIGALLPVGLAVKNTSTTSEQ